MGVPALFRWLSKKYPKIIFPVEEEEETTMKGDGEDIVIPINMAMPNPNGVEFDNLYLDMNGIVHPCTHPEGKPAPETEEEMMVEIFKYTERVVNMVRPRKLLFMAIDGVAPRAKMNQQRSRRFRAAQEAKEKEEARKESLLLWESMGLELTEEQKQEKVAWDSNAITPGTPFMDLLATSLRYWVVQKMNTDPGWKNIQVLISDAGVPGEGEHKIMDYIRRQRSHFGYDANTHHVIYGLDADLIMLALATHEPHFRVLREDVFANAVSASACRNCGQEGHYAAQCTGTKADIQKPSTPSDQKPFIFLDVAILREYLEVELDVPNSSFPFSLEEAIDDWVLLIFFVGNDFLPHLPSLEIREGAIDTLLKIWKNELPRMGGYMTNHGHLVLQRAQIILEGLARREDEIFRRRREAEERQDQNSKRRKIEQQQRDGKTDFSAGPSQTMALTAAPAAPASGSSTPSLHPSLPKRPAHDFAANADSIGLGAKQTAESVQNAPTAAQALAGSNRDVVANRRAIRMANMSAAEVLKAELSGLSPVKPSANSASKPPVTPALEPEPAKGVQTQAMNDIVDTIPGLSPVAELIPVVQQPAESIPSQDDSADADADADGDIDTEEVAVGGDVYNDQEMDDVSSILAGAKRKFEEGPGDTAKIVDNDAVPIEDDDDDAAAPPMALKVNADGTVEQADTVKLWEPGYQERYYRQKFGVELTDSQFRYQITKSYIEGLAWVLHYYYQGTPSWQWYYPYHFAPFAADFEEIDKMDIKFDLGQPFKPYEQLMGVFPAASRKHIPKVFHRFMTDEDSPIIDFYPETFEIDMNGKKMTWQGVALLPFIDPKRLLEAMAIEYPNITEDEIRRNRWGNNVMFAAVDHPLYPFYESLYGKRKNQEPVPIDNTQSHGMSGSVLPNPDCLPGSTYYSPLPEQGLPDIKNDRSLSVLYFFPKQMVPHRSVMLAGARRGPRVLTSSDLEVTRNGGRGRGRGGGFHNTRGNGMDRGRNDQFHTRSNNYNPQGYNNDRNGPNRGGYRGDSRGGYRGDSSGGYSGGGYGGGGRGYGGGDGGSYGGRGGNSYQQNSYSRPPYQSQAPPSNNYDNSGSYGGRGGYGADSHPRGNQGGYNSYGNSDRNSYSAPQNSYSSYRNPSVAPAPAPATGGYGGYGGYGGGNAAGGGGGSGGYGGYGSYGAGNNHTNNSGRGGGPYNGNAPRGRGRGW